METEELNQILEAGAAAAERLSKNARGLDRAWGTGTLEDWMTAYRAEEFQDGSGSDDNGSGGKPADGTGGT